MSHDPVPRTVTGRPLPRSSPTTAPYWSAAGEGRLVLRRCTSCDRWHHPPRAWCPGCWSMDLVWEPASGRGELITFTIVHQSPSAGFESPYVLAVVRLEEGPQMVTNLVQCPPAAATVGLPVEVTFEDHGDLTLPQFRPAGPR